MILVRLATEADVPAMSETMIRSITDLCGADHHNDPALIARWTANKTPDGVRKMLANPAAALFVAERDGAVVAVGAVGGGEVLLNYVHPDHRFAGVSKALLAALEARLMADGLHEGRLTSTATAAGFYRAAGWVDHGPPEESFGMSGQPMRKAL